MNTHILQTKYWAEFKKDYGTPTVSAGNVFYTKHKIPFTKLFYANCPRVNPFEIDFEKLKVSLQKEHCIACHFDVPNVFEKTAEGENAKELLEQHCKRSPRNEFARGNFFIDLTKTEETLLNEMHYKQRYNIKLAEKKGIKLRKHGEHDLDIFYELYKETAERQGYFSRSKTYFEKLWAVFDKAGIGHIVTVEYEGKPLSSWMLFVYEDVLYYPYGGSSTELKNLQHSALVGWEAIKLGKKLKCEAFDMWGAAVDPENTKDPYYGFTDFKRKFGGKHVVYISSYDLVINPTLYFLFNIANLLRWRFLNMLR